MDSPSLMMIMLVSSLQKIYQTIARNHFIDIFPWSFGFILGLASGSRLSRQGQGELLQVAWLSISTVQTAFPWVNPMYALLKADPLHFTPFTARSSCFFPIYSLLENPINRSLSSTSLACTTVLCSKVGFSFRTFKMSENFNFLSRPSCRRKRFRKHSYQWQYNKFFIMQITALCVAP